MIYLVNEKSVHAYKGIKFKGLASLKRHPYGDDVKCWQFRIEKTGRDILIASYNLWKEIFDESTCKYKIPEGEAIDNEIAYYAEENEDVFKVLLSFLYQSEV